MIVSHDAPPVVGHLLSPHVGIGKSRRLITGTRFLNIGQQIFRPDLGVNPVGAIAFLMSLMSMATIPLAAREKRSQKSRSRADIALETTS
jgi:hypothetical protein